MMSIGLRISVNGTIGLLERKLRVHMRGMDRMMQEVMCSLTPVAEAAVAEEAQPLRIARTVLPDNRADFNETFQHIRLEHDRFYKQQVPIFNNSVVAELNDCELPASEVQVANQTLLPEVQQVQCDLTAPAEQQMLSLAVDTTIAVKVVLAEEWEMRRISRTVLPEQRPGFNETFQHIRQESDRFYKQQVAVFDNILPTESTEASDNEHASAEQGQATEKDHSVAAAHEITMTSGVRELVDLYLSTEKAKAKARTDLAARIASVKKAQAKKASASALSYSQLDLLRLIQSSLAPKQALTHKPTSTAKPSPGPEPDYSIQN